MPTSVRKEPIDAVPPWRQPRYSPRDFLRADRAAGTITDGHGRRVWLVPVEFLGAFRTAVARVAGDRSAEVARAIGAAWGAADMAAFQSRSENEFGIGLPKVHIGVALQTWWWPWQATGWGAANFDLQDLAQRQIWIDLSASASARAAPNGASVCDLYAGIFAGGFEQLTGKALCGAEVACRAAGADQCRFVVTTKSRAAAALDWRHAGIQPDEIRRRLSEPSAGTPKPKGAGR